MWKSISNILNQPYPENESPYAVFVSQFWAALVVFLILYFFKPFGLAETGDDLLWACSTFAAVTYGTGIVYEYALLRQLPIKRDTTKWMFKHWFISILGLVLCIATANYFTIYLLFGGGGSFNWFFYGQMILDTMLVAIFPTLIAGLITQNRNLKRNLKAAEILEDELHGPTSAEKQLLINSKDNQEAFRCDSNALLAIEAQQNYVVIFHYFNDTIEKQTLRSSLSAICEQICDEEIIRCHRSFVVNTSLVQHVKGNAQGLTLTVADKLQIPVSRSYIGAIRAAVSQ